MSFIESKIDDLRHSNHKGYKVVFLPSHPNAWSNSGLVYVHRVVMENSIGRYLKITEHIHHINGDKSDNDIDNLMITSSKEHGKNHRTLLDKECHVCRKQFHPNKDSSKYCSPACASKGMERIEWPSNTDLEMLVWRVPTSRLAAILGVSDSAIGKRCRKKGIKKPCRGYWQRLK